MDTAAGELKKGGREYKLARNLVSKMIERPGPDAALASIRSKQSDFLDQIEVWGSFDDCGRKIPETKF